MRRWRQLLIGSIILVSLISLPSFLEHALWFISGQAEQFVIQGRWDLVALNIGIFLLFAAPLLIGLKGQVNWQTSSLGIYAAFMVSMFVEMYGVPLSIYLSAAALTTTTGSHPHDVILSFDLLGQSFAMTPWKVIGLGITVLGCLIVAIGWYTLYRSDESFVTDGIYQYSRHPQYLGLIMIVAGWFIHWPSLLTLAMLPVLVYVYYRLSVSEEQHLETMLEDTTDLEEYRETTPRFI
ncbi:MAG: DUF1295 domain-containing protein [Candidatus Nanohaloarchaeota archaeon QJJ-5]|nr:DUF1295 domain-containing protein [Candidatus Nanohaloarchaeota archaeon QJJ-5]